MRLPWSRRLLTQPMRVMVSPEFVLRRFPHISVRCKLPRKSKVTIFLLYETAAGWGRAAISFERRRAKIFIRKRGCNDMVSRT